MAGAEVLTRDQQKRITGGTACYCPGAGCGTCTDGCGMNSCGGREGCSAGSYGGGKQK